MCIIICDFLRNINPAISKPCLHTIRFQASYCCTLPAPPLCFRLPSSRLQSARNFHPAEQLLFFLLFQSCHSVHKYHLHLNKIFLRLSPDSLHNYIRPHLNVLVFHHHCSFVIIFYLYRIVDYIKISAFA